MSFIVHLYSHSKRDNSTKRPTTDPVSYNCVMKHGSGILSPSISLDIGLSDAPEQYNYAYIPAFKRYYFIEEWVFDERLWTAQLKVDVLATYRTQIGNSSLYVLRSSEAFDGRVIDTLYPCKTGCNFQRVTHNNPWTSSSFIVGIVNSAAAFGSLNYYQLSAGQLGVMCSYLMDAEHIIDPEKGFNVDELGVGLQLSLVDPIQYIKSCIMLPTTSISNTGGTVSNIPVFNFDSHATGERILPSSRIYHSYSFEIPQHPDTESRGNYVNSAPYTALTLTIPPWGCIDIDTSVTANATTLNIEVEVDPISGKGILVVKCNNIILNRIEAQIGVPISLSSVTRDYIGVITNTVGAIASGVGGIAGAVGSSSKAGAVSSIAGGVGGVVSGIGNAVNSLYPRAQTVGSTGSFVANRGEFRLDAQFFRPVADDIAHNGRPLCAVRNIANLGGYMLIQDGDVSTTGTSTEDETIRNYLESGFYYE